MASALTACSPRSDYKLELLMKKKKKSRMNPPGTLTASELRSSLTHRARTSAGPFLLNDIEAENRCAVTRASWMPIFYGE